MKVGLEATEVDAAFVLLAQLTARMDSLERELERIWRTLEILGKGSECLTPKK